MAPQSRFLSLWFLIGLVLTGCNEPSTSLGGDPQSRLALQTLSPVEKEVVSQDLAFGLKLLSALSDSSGTSDNLLISPLSLSIALTMAYNGARGETETAMRATLGHGDMPRETLNALYGKLLPALAKADGDVRLTLASSLWSQKGWDIAPEFRDLNRLTFDAETREVDFQSSEAAAMINGWAREKTQGLIKEIVEPSLGGFLLMFLNALTFKGTWSRPFDPKATGQAIFRKEDGTETSTPMMHALGYFRCFENDGVRGLDLPYGDSLFSMVFLLPPEGEPVGAFAKGLSTERWEAWMAAIGRRHGEVAIPRFTFEYSRILNSVLSGLGMEKAFSAEADFTGIHAPGGLRISKVLQKTYLRVDEAGTVAAVVSVGGMSDASPSYVIRLNRPFVFAIRERTSGALLFLGWVKDPSG